MTEGSQEKSVVPPGPVQVAGDRQQLQDRADAGEQSQSQQDRDRQLQDRADAGEQSQSQQDRDGQLQDRADAGGQSQSAALAGSRTAVRHGPVFVFVCDILDVLSSYVFYVLLTLFGVL